MLTRSRAQASKQPVFIDDKWNDAYIQTKDEQIDAMLAADASQRGWDELEEENSDASDGDADRDEDVWRSDGEESEDDEDDWIIDRKPLTLSFVERWVAGGGLVENVSWTVGTLLLAPLAVYVSLPRSKDQLWPLRSVRLAGTVWKVALNLLTLAATAMALYGASCGLEPLTLTSGLYWRQLEMETPLECSYRLIGGGSVAVEAVVDAVSLTTSSETPLRRLDEDLWTLVATLDTPVVHELTRLVLGALLSICCFYRVWAKILVLSMATSYVVFNVATEVQLNQRAAVEIFSLDPNFAFVNESIFIAIDGQNLEQGGFVAWAPYWGGLQQHQTEVCPKQFPQQLSNGGVLVTFGQVNEYVPCYLSASASASATVVDGEIRPAEAFQCFESIRLRVKDQKSVPGWSLNQPQQVEAISTMEK
ncbi:DNA helicase rad5 [Phytophthora boehmeriae]|uniref:DNA helicase rad5 n=1 Tax=Phytophthora boehmeriae TaxID=109152 RepID=A0A8T1WS57_9STRA|nr:DNA helicase rad5 [Phytophthora boehmeriae]